VIDQAEDRLKKRQEKETQRKSATRKLRLPGKLADCTRDGQNGTEYSWSKAKRRRLGKQARDRNTQAVLPLRGKILNVASATRESSSRTRNSPIWCRRWAAERARSIATKTCAIRTRHRQ